MSRKPPHSAPPLATARSNAASCSEVLDSLFEMQASEDCLRRALDVVLQQLQSDRIILGQLDEYGELVILHERSGQGDVPDGDDLLGFDSESWRGSWGAALALGQVRIANDPQQLGPRRFHSGRELSAPLRFDANVIGLLYVADKASDYTEDDAKEIALYARRIAPVLAYMRTHKRFQRQLDAAEEMANAAVEGERFFMMSRDPMIISDGGIRRANAAFGILLGLSPQELRGKSLGEMTHPKDRKLLQSEMDQMRTEPNREHPPLAVDMVTSGGERRRVEWVGAATEDGRVYAVGRDITVLAAAMEELEVSNVELQRLHAEDRAEEQLAGRVLAHMSKQGCLDSPGIQYIASALGFFSGDTTLASITPDGELRWLLGDFTGHGLQAAIGTVPLAGTFHNGCRKNLGFTELICEINDTLKVLLPPGLFCSAALVSLSRDAGTLQVWNCGLPPILLRRVSDGSVQAYPSQSLPLGLLGSAELEIAPTRVDVNAGDDVFVFSDGLTESADATGQLFGVDRVISVLAESRVPGEGFTAILNALARFRGDVRVSDDLSLVCVSVGQTPVSTPGSRRGVAQDPGSSTDSSRR